MAVDDKGAVTDDKKLAVSRKARKWLRNLVGLIGACASAVCLIFPAWSEEPPVQKIGFFENLLGEKHQPRLPTCAGQDLTENFSSSEKRTFLSRAGKVINGHARFWKVEKAGIKPSYLFGTMHVTDPDIVNLAEPVKLAFDHADRVILELREIADDSGKTIAGRLAGSDDFMTTKKGESFKDKLSPEEFLRFKKALETQGLSYSLVANSKPWLIFMMLSVPACETRRQSSGYQALDAKIGQDAIKLGKPVIGLETIDEQLAALDELPLSLFARAIEDYLNNPDLYKNLFYTQMRLYKTDRIGEILALNSMFNSGIRASDWNIFNSVMISKRNLRMCKRALPLVKQGNSFIAVGAAHLVGESGLVEQLRKHNYHVTPVNLAQ
ncbi:TraB/GumN family protein [uncultured Bartonella sp.]|uniref:TraB/GumN family protein n=1 Tax=uncultured Bartonella sp. TaxID=104108 RepID=UPI00261BED30|nr:TraB/GumN family protein [uncultured Bartonella sp.]